MTIEQYEKARVIMNRVNNMEIELGKDFVAMTNRYYHGLEGVVSRAEVADAVAELNSTIHDRIQIAIDREKAKLEEL